MSEEATEVELKKTSFNEPKTLMVSGLEALHSVDDALETRRKQSRESISRVNEE